MKQVVLRGGAPHLADVPAPRPAPGWVLVANAASVISSGTERASVAVSGGSLPMRAIRNPRLVAQTLKHAREKGVRDTVQLVRGAIADDVVLGYSTAGVVLDTGGVPGLAAGDRVACAGAGKANHAEVVSVPGNLVAAVPDGVSLRDAAFTTLGAIALQGVRRAGPTLGERVVVVGLGLLGLLTAQLLRANGCQVVGVEPAAERRALALELGVELALDPDGAPAAVDAWTGGVGTDAVVITASGPSDAIVNGAIAMLRRKGRVVPVGDIGLDLERAPLYQREADVLISTSYGPGRYDALYEEGGVDYPIAYVRWTEQRNMEEFLRLLATGQVRVGPLVGLELPAGRAAEAYEAIRSDAPPPAAVLTYDRSPDGVASEVVRISSPRRRRSAGPELEVGVVGAGGFVRSMHLPNLRNRPGVRITKVVARRGTSASDVARWLGGGEAATDWRVVTDDPDIDLVVVGTRHDTHAEIAAAALRAGKAVFVEKPLGLTREEIDDVADAAGADPRMAIGFNRPFAPLSRALRRGVDAATGPLHVVYRVSAPLPRDHWLNDPLQGGGRLLGEGCHMLDYANWLCGTPLRVQACALPAPEGLRTHESTTVTVQYAGGSVATVIYSGVGAPGMPKERVEVLRGGWSWVLDDFRALTAYGPGGEPRVDERGAGDKGHGALLDGVLAAARGTAPFEPGLGAAYAAMSVGFSALDSIAGGEAVGVRLLGEPGPAQASERPATQ